jgi:hypothetical protein
MRIESDGLPSVGHMLRPQKAANFGSGSPEPSRRHEPERPKSSYSKQRCATRTMPWVRVAFFAPVTRRAFGRAQNRFCASQLRINPLSSEAAESVNAKDKLVCEVCGTPLSGGSEPCPVCALRGALWPETTALLDSSSELRFEHYQVLKNKDETPVELGRGAMGITYTKPWMSICSAWWLSRSLMRDSRAMTRPGVVLYERREQQPASGIPMWLRSFILVKAAAITSTRWSLSMGKR